MQPIKTTGKQIPGIVSFSSHQYVQTIPLTELVIETTLRPILMRWIETIFIVRLVYTVPWHTIADLTTYLCTQFSVQFSNNKKIKMPIYLSMQRVRFSSPDAYEKFKVYPEDMF